jgi:hypothetical protein
MNRRTFLSSVGHVIVVLPAGAWFTACGDSGGGGGGGGTTDAGTTDGGTQNLVFTSTVESGHTHTVTLTMTELTAPPSAGTTKTTSITDGHDHTVELSQADLQSINAGNTVTKRTSINAGHDHGFSFRKT